MMPKADRHGDAERRGDEQERHADKDEEEAAEIAADQMPVLGAAIGAVEPVADRLDRAGDRDERDQKAEGQRARLVGRGEDAVQLRLERLDDMLRKDRQRLAADIGGELGAAEHRAERHQKNREGEEREDQREGDGARHHHAVMAEKPVGGVVQHGADRPEPPPDARERGRTSARLARVQPRYPPCHRFERLRAAKVSRRQPYANSDRISHSPCIAHR